MAPAVLLLAAGASRRMGRCKQALPWGKTTLVGHAADRLLALSPSRLLVVTGAGAGQVVAALEGRDLETFHCATWQSGQRASIACGLHELLTGTPSGGILIALADQPLLTTEDFRALTGAGRVAAANYGGVPGAPAFFPPESYAYLRAEIDGERNSVKALLSELVAERLVFGERLRDADTEEDYQYLLATRTS